MERVRGMVLTGSTWPCCCRPGEQQALGPQSLRGKCERPLNEHPEVGTVVSSEEGNVHLRKMAFGQVSRP